MEFKNYKREKVDLIQHCFEQKAKHKNLVVFIGTDSISVGGQVHYFTVVAFRYARNGAHFIYTKEKVPTYRQADGKPDIFTKLWRECQLTIDLSERLIAENVFNRDQIIIELDYNAVVETISNKLIPATKGWALNLGYQVLTKYGEYVLVEFEGGIEKVEEQIAVKAANHLCQGVSG